MFCFSWKVSFLQVFHKKLCVHLSVLLCVLASQPPWLNHAIQSWVCVMKQFFALPSSILSLLWSKYSLQHSVLKHPLRVPFPGGKRLSTSFTWNTLDYRSLHLSCIFIMRWEDKWLWNGLDQLFPIFNPLLISFSMQILCNFHIH